MLAVSARFCVLFGISNRLLELGCRPIDNASATNVCPRRWMMPIDLSCFHSSIFRSSILCLTHKISLAWPSNCVIAPQIWRLAFAVLQTVLLHAAYVPLCQNLFYVIWGNTQVFFPVSIHKTSEINIITVSVTYLNLWVVSTFSNVILQSKLRTLWSLFPRSLK